MEIREGVVVAVWKLVDGAARFGVLKRQKGWEGWELVKGAKKEEESYKEAAKRELKEETGIEEIQKIEDMKREHSWRYKKDGDKIESRYRSFIAKVPSDSKIDVSQNPHEEHSKGFFLNPRDSKDISTHENQKKLIEEVMERIKEEYS